MKRYPLYIDGEKNGELKVYEDGLMTCFEAWSERKNGLVKLNIYGTGKEVYLGTMQPCGGRLQLMKKFSRQELRKLPSEIEYAANEGLNEKESDTLWCRSGKGVLICAEKGLVAVPTDKKGIPARYIRRIEDRNYIVFPGKFK